MDSNKELVLFLASNGDGTYSLPPGTQILNTDPDDVLTVSDMAHARQERARVRFYNEVITKNVYVLGMGHDRLLFIKMSELG